MTTTRGSDAGERVRFAEGSTVHTLHVGPYDEEGPVLARMHAKAIADRGAVPSGHHHEISLSDPAGSSPRD